MNRWKQNVALLALALLALWPMKCHSATALNRTPMAIDANGKLYSYIPYISQLSTTAPLRDGHALNGNPADSLVGIAAETTSVIPVFGARHVMIWYRDSTDGAGTSASLACTGCAAAARGADSALVYVRFSNSAMTDTSNASLVWSPTILANTAYSSLASANDTLGITVSGVANGSTPLAGNAFTRGGYNILNILPGPPATTNDLVRTFRVRWMQIIIAGNTSRKRCSDCTGTVPLVGMRVRVHVISDVPPVYVRKEFE